MRQFTIKLASHDAGNFYAYGQFEKIIEAGWCLRHRIEFGDSEMLVFETDNGDLAAFRGHWPYDQFLNTATIYQPVVK